MFLLQLFSLALTVRKPIREHFSQLRRVGQRCYFSSNETIDFFNLAAVETSSPTKRTSEFVIQGFIIQGVSMGSLLIGSLDSPQRLVAIVDTGSSSLVAKGKFAVEPLTDAEISDYFENHLYKYTLERTCPVHYEEFLCTEANYGSESLLTALSKTNVFLQEGGSFSAFLEYIVGKTDHSSDFFKDSEIASIIGVGYQDGEFATNSFWVAARAALLERSSEKVPNTFALRFVGKRFDAVFGAQVVDTEFVWLPLGNEIWNTTVLEGMWTNSGSERVQLLTRTNILFDTGSNVVSIPQRQLSAFKQKLAGVLKHSPEWLIEENDKYDNIFYLCTSSNFAIGTQLIFETGAAMVLDLADFLVFKVDEYKCAVFIGDENTNLLIVGLSAWKGFDLVLDGDKNRLGFKPNKNLCQFCSVSDRPISYTNV